MAQKIKVSFGQGEYPRVSGDFNSYLD